MRRWNGWGMDQVDYPVPASARVRLTEWIGEAQRVPDAPIEAVLKTIPTSPLPPHPLIRTNAEDRLRHARGQSLPDWVALRFGRITVFPAGVAYPEGDHDLLALFHFAKEHDAVLIPYGGGTSVVGHINPDPAGLPAAITVDMSRMSALLRLDPESQLATFGAGIRGPLLEAALCTHGLTLGHYPQSFECSTLGGWIATRSSGQQSLYYGRIEQHFAGGRLVTPAGALEMQPYPASAAGPDLRHLVLGSEGRMGIISEAIIRVTRLPEAETFSAIFFRSWENAIAAVRMMVQARLPLSMLRLSTAEETESMLALGGHEQLVSLAHRGLYLLGYRRRAKCMLIVGATGRAGSVAQARRSALGIALRHGGMPAGQYLGKHWARTRFLTPYLRNSFWEAGYAIDTLETALPWTEVLPAAAAIQHAIRETAKSFGERVHVFAHLSHLYETGASIYTTFVFRVLPDPDLMLEFWHRMKCAASEAIIRHCGTISHQHGVGFDHARYLPAEKGPLGMALIGDAIHRCDPDQMLNPGKLLLSQMGEPEQGAMR